MTSPDTKAIRALKSKRSKCADVGNLDLSNVPESHETIWLQWGDNGGDDDTWCASNVNDEDVPYIRADLVHSLCDALEDERAENARLRAALQKISAGEGYYGEQAREYKYIARAALAQKGGE